MLVLVTLGMIWYKFNYHELWKDEWQAWLVARDMNTMDMLSFLHYEGHPSLWYLYLQLWTILPIQDAIAIQIAHVIVVVVAMYILLIRIKLPTIWKILLLLSYFMIYEYGIVNRGYILVIVISLALADQIANKRERYLGLSLFLLCQTEVYGVILSVAFLVYLIWSDESWRKQVKRYRSTLIWSAIGVLLFVLTVFPRGYADDFSRAYNQQGLSMSVIGEAIQGHLANVFAIGAIKDTAANGPSTTGLLLSFLILAFLTYIFRRETRSARLLLTGAAGLILFAIVIFSGGIRQWGMIYLCFMCALILSHAARSDWQVGRTMAVTALLILPVIHGVRGLHIDSKIPFSNAREAGLFIKEKVPTNVPVVVINKFETAPVGAYAERALYELPSGERFTYFRWLEKVYIPTQEELSLFTKYKNVGGIVLLSPTPIDSGRFPKALLWQSFTDENFKRENYYLYSVPL